MAQGLTLTIMTKLFAITAGLLFAGCSDGTSSVLARPAPGVMEPLPDGRTIHLDCSGSGSPTVLFESGFGGDAGGWDKTRRHLKRVVRVCAYDRASYGYSEPGPEPRDGAAIARDLDGALDAAGIGSPFIVVGHSAGGLYGRIFAARRPGEVLGLILLDPTVERIAPQGGDGLQGQRRKIDRCLAAARAVAAPEHPDWAGCIPPRASGAALAMARRPEIWSNRRSELDSIFADTSVQVARTTAVNRGIPTYVFTASETAATSPTVGVNPPQSVWELQHMRLASNFLRGSQRTIYSSHLIQNDRPEVVAEAVAAMVAAVRAGKPPEPLPLSETAPPEGEPAFPEAPR